MDDVKRHCGIHQSRSRFCLAGLRRLDQRFAVFDNDLHDDRDGRGWHGDVFENDYGYAEPRPVLFASPCGEQDRLDHDERDLGRHRSHYRFSGGRKFATLKRHS